jgi:O-antigen ligase
MPSAESLQAPQMDRPPSVQWTPRGIQVTLAVASIAAAAGFAWDPWLSFGVLLGGTLLGLTLRWPLGVVAAMLAIGPLDLSFLTGGFKTMFQQMGGLDMNGIRLIFVSVGFGLVILTDRRCWAALASLPVRWYLLFLAYAASTLVASPDAIEGARLLMKLAWPLLIFLIVSARGRTHAELDRLVDWLLIGAAVLIVINPVFIALGDVYIEDSGRVRLMGAGTHQNPFSFAMLVAMLVALVRFASRGQARYLLLAGGAAIWIALSLTRITFLAGAVSLGTVALYSAVVRRDFRAAALGIVAATALTAALAPFILERTFGTIPSLAQFFTLLRDPIALYQEINWSGRELFWAVLVFSWMASPWFGLGLGSSTVVLTAVFPEEMGLVAHNEYIRLGTDTGLVGLTLFAMAMIAWVRVSVRAGLRSDVRTQEMVLPALAIMVAWAVIALTDNAFDYYGPFTQFAGFFVGASVASRSWNGPSS